ncbi:tigger transposable element-derived protein 4-like [Euwallacea similis]|uniref:tigger transposable element-derived protein 4-like n=1 Tax=Euwallacea similis TaxID=1736056 RepID=UPI00344F6DBC
MGLSKSTVATIWKNKETILKTFESGQHSNVKKIKKPNNYEVDQRLLKWFSQQRNNNAIVSGAILQSKAEDFASKVSGNQEPKFNRSWIERFKRRHNITSGRIAGESTSVDMNIVDDWLQNKWPIIRSNFKDEDIFNGDETGLFFKLTPDRTLKFKGQTCEGGKLSKERITIFVVANLTGSEKRKLLVIGKSKNPRYFKNIVQLPVTYKSNKRAWMNSEIFINALREWDEELRRKKRKIILLVDNCPAHPDVKNLMWITLVFMPPNTSSKLQPMDQGVIHSLKSHYRRLLLSEMISCMDSGKEKFIITLLDAIRFIHMAWQKVSKQTIRNCFRHAGFLENENFDSDDDLPLVEWLKKNQCKNKTDIQEDFLQTNNDFHEFVHVDDNLVSVEFLDDNAIIASVSSASDTYDDDEEDEDAAYENNEIISVPTTTEALRYVSSIRQFLQSRNTPQNVLDGIAHIRDISNRDNRFSRLVKLKRREILFRSKSLRLQVTALLAQKLAQV